MMQVTKPRLASIAVVVLLLTIAQAQAVQIITNGNFETASFAGWTAGSTQNTTSFQAALNDGQNAQIINGAFGGPAWYLRDKNANYFGSPNIAMPINGYSAFNGFDGDPGYFFLRQGFSTTGTLSSADLDFDYAVQSSYANLSRVFTVNILDPSNTPLANVFSYTRPTGFFPAWSPTNVNTDISTALNSLGPGNYQLEFRIDIPQSYTGPAQFAIDNISLDLTPVPEPATIVLCGCGGLGIAIVAFRRRRRKNVARALSFPARP
jgi:hypothetical protein